MAGDEVSYPSDDLKAAMVDGKWQFLHEEATGAGGVALSRRHGAGGA